MKNLAFYNNLRNRSRNKNLLPKSANLSDRHFFMRMLDKQW